MSEDIDRDWTFGIVAGAVLVALANDDIGCICDTFGIDKEFISFMDVSTEKSTLRRDKWDWVIVVGYSE